MNYKREDRTPPTSKDHADPILGTVLIVFTIIRIERKVYNFEMLTMSWQPCSCRINSPQSSGM